MTLEQMRQIGRDYRDAGKQLGYQYDPTIYNQISVESKKRYAGQPETNRVRWINRMVTALNKGWMERHIEITDQDPVIIAMRQEWAEAAKQREIDFPKQLADRIARARAQAT